LHFSVCPILKRSSVCLSVFFSSFGSEASLFGPLIYFSLGSDLPDDILHSILDLSSTPRRMANKAELNETFYKL